MKKFVCFVGVLGMMGMVALLGQVAFGNEVTVYPGGATYTTIQAGINACPNGGTVSVAAGTYNEAIYINKGIALIGKGTPLAVREQNKIFLDSRYKLCYSNIIKESKTRIYEEVKNGYFE